MAAFEVIALDTATPQLRAPGAADTYTFPRAVEMPLGIANGVLYLNGSKVVTSGSGLTFDGTNFGVGTISPIAGSGLTIGNDGNSNATVKLAFSTAATERASIQLNGGSGELRLTAGYAGYGGFQTFFANGSEQMRLTSTGLGIGTNSPDAKLDVVVTAGLAAIFGSESAASSYTGWKYNSTTLGYVGNGAGVAAGAGATDFAIGSTGARALVFGTNDTERARIPAAGGMVIGTAALATNATDGFLYVPTCAGTPTGTPTTQTGTAPIVINTTNNKLYFYSGGAWRDAGP